MQTISIRCTETAYRSLYESTETDKTSVILGITLVLMILIFSFSAKNGTSSAGMSIGYAERTCKDPKLSWILPDSF